MSQISHIEAENIALTEVSAATAKPLKAVSIRVSPGGYLAAFFISTFVTGLFVYLEWDLTAAIIAFTCWIILPVLSVSDKIIFDGKSIYRSGIIFKLWKRLSSQPEKLKISEIELIETQAIRAMKNGSNVMYRYRTSVNGLNQNLVFSSGGEDYRRMIEKLFRAVEEESLDVRSIELRDYYSENEAILRKAAFARIPSVEVLESSFKEIKDEFKSAKLKKYSPEYKIDSGKVNDLRLLANQLRLAGSLLQSLEAFRRALRIKPDDAKLIFEYARCLHSYASLQRSIELTKKANAALRLARIKAPNDANLNALIGETYFQVGDYARAKSSFNKSNLAVENFRAIRGLAEISLREGKIAYVILYFQNAFDFAKTTALKTWSKNEREYYSLLNSDEHYMESEVKRIKHLEHAETGRKFFLKIALSGIFLTLIGIVSASELANFGWVLSSIGIAMWILSLIFRGLLLQRTPFAFEDE